MGFWIAQYIAVKAQAHREPVTWVTEVTVRAFYGWGPGEPELPGGRKNGS